MDWFTVFVSAGSSAISGPLAAGLISFLIERKKARQSQELLDTQNAFSIGVTSHMATVAFDKHVEFCEKYHKEVYRRLQAFVQDRVTQGPLDVASFFRLRQEWALWLTNEIDSELERFERRVMQLGGDAPDVDANGERRGSDEASIKRAIAFLREVLQTEELTALRNELVMRSSGKSPNKA
jgi:hypothetical protein